MGKEICKWYSVCPMRLFYKEGKLDKKWIEQYCFNGGQNCKRYEMEEKGIPHPDNMLPDGTIDESLK
ncbi:uracil-DNA glycosylase [bacterium]|nr:uracil-DNA glycosylase [bacterium]